MTTKAQDKLVSFMKNAPTTLAAVAVLAGFGWPQVVENPGRWVIVVSGLLTVFGSMVLSWQASIWATEETRAQKYADERAHLQKEVCGPVAMIATSADYINQMRLDMRDGDLVPPQFVAATDVMVRQAFSAIGAVYNAFGVDFKDQSAQIQAAVAQAVMEAPNPPKAAQEVEERPPSSVLAEPPRTVRLTFSCPHCSTAIRGIKSPPGVPWRECYCLHCFAKIRVLMPSRTPELVKVLTPVWDARIITVLNRRAVLACPVCGEAKDSFFVTTIFSYAACVHDDRILIAKRAAIDAWTPNLAD